MVFTQIFWDYSIIFQRILQWLTDIHYAPQHTRAHAFIQTGETAVYEHAKMLTLHEVIADLHEPKTRKVWHGTIDNFRLTEGCVKRCSKKWGKNESLADLHPFSASYQVSDIDNRMFWQASVLQSCFASISLFFSIFKKIILLEKGLSTKKIALDKHKYLNTLLPWTARGHQKWNKWSFKT